MASTPGSSTYLETKLGLDLRGGLRVEYQVLPTEGKVPSQDDLNVMRQIIISRYQWHMSVPKLAHRLGVSLSTARRRLDHAEWAVHIEYSRS